MKILESYGIVVDNVKTKISIIEGLGPMKRYDIKLPKLLPATKALLTEVKRKLITEVAITTAEILDPKVIEKLKVKFKHTAQKIIKYYIPNIKPEIKDMLIALLIHEMLGLGKIEYLLSDIQLEEIVINTSAEPVKVYHKKYGWLETNITLATEEQIQNYSNIIARRIGRQITTLNPLLDAHLVTGDRANAVLYPISNKGNTITIRKFARDPWTVTDFIQNKTCTAELFALIWLTMQYEFNILISGGTGSGKTSLLNVCMPFIPPNHRIISIEDTRELQLPKFLYWCPLTVRPANPEGKGEITMLQLLINSLRMRPDRIILGEMRKKEQAEVLFEAMHTGHSVYATVHADSTNETIQRLVNPPIEVPANLLTAVHLNVVMFRDRKRNIRRIFQVGEFIPSEETGGITVKPNILYRWKPRKDKIVPHSQSFRLFEELSRHTGMSQQEIQDDLDKKTRILNYMVKNNIRHINQVGKLMADYYTNPELIMEKIGDEK